MVRVYHDCVVNTFDLLRNLIDFIVCRELAVTGLQNISRLSMFHGRELRPNSLQPFARPVAKHIKSLRSQVARAACTAMQKMFSFVPKSAEPVSCYLLE